MTGAGVHNWVADETASARRSLVESVLADKELGARVLSHSLTTNDKRRIAKAYEACFNTQLRKTCANCYADAYLTIRNKNLNEIMDKCKYTLKNGAVIEFDNKPYSNKNLTNEVAEAFMAKFPTNRFFVLAPEVKKAAPADLTPPAFLGANGQPLKGAALTAAKKAKAKEEAEAAEKAKAEAEAAEKAKAEADQTDGGEADQTDEGDSTPLE